MIPVAAPTNDREGWALRQDFKKNVRLSSISDLSAPLKRKATNNKGGVRGGWGVRRDLERPELVKQS